MSRNLCLYFGRHSIGYILFATKSLTGRKDGIAHGRWTRHITIHMDIREGRAIHKDRTHGKDGKDGKGGTWSSFACCVPVFEIGWEEMG